MYKFKIHYEVLKQCLVLRLRIQLWEEMRFIGSIKINCFQKPSMREKLIYFYLKLYYKLNKIKIQLDWKQIKLLT